MGIRRQGSGTESAERRRERDWTGPRRARGGARSGACSTRRDAVVDLRDARPGGAGGKLRRRPGNSPRVEQAGGGADEAATRGVSPELEGVSPRRGYRA